MLAESKIMGFIPSTDLDVSNSFFEGKLGLALMKRDEFALEFVVGQATLRVTKVAEIVSASYTVLGWEVADIESVVKELMKHGVLFEKYDGFSQDIVGINTFPGGSKVAWFKDPDGNTLSITQPAN